MKVPFIKVETDPTHTSDVPLIVGVECTDDQSLSSLGLHFRLKVSNKSDETIQLHNPYESISYQITNSEGWPVTVSAPPRAAKIHGPRRSPSAKARYLDVTNADQDGKNITVEDAMTARTFDLQVGVTLSFGLRVGYVLPTPQSDTPVPVPTGEYHLKVLLPISWVMNGKKHNVILRSAETFMIKLLPL